MAINLRPYQEQLKAEVYAAWDTTHRNVLAVMPTGCVAGDSTIRLNRRRKGFQCTIADEYRRQSKRKRMMVTSIRGLKPDKSGVGLVNLMWGIKHSGIRECIKLTSASRSLTLTPEHLVWTHDGWVEAQHMVGKQWAIDNHQPVKSKMPPRPKLRDSYYNCLVNHPYAILVTPTRLRDNPYKKIEKHRAIYEAALNDLSLSEYLHIIRTDTAKSKTLKYMNPKTHEIHHIDGDHYNNEVMNLQCLTKEDHAAIHKHEHYSKFSQGMLNWEEVTHIESVGPIEVFDACGSATDSFTANDVVVHNSGKTKTFCSIAMDKAVHPKNKMPTAIMVHRKELVQQISLTLAEEEIQHNIIAPRPTILGIVGAHRRVTGRQFYDYNAPISVISVDTLNARISKHMNWAKSIRFWITDEAAHLLKNNKWGRAVEYFPNAIGLGVTATPERLDKRGLGRHADGVFDAMVEGPSVRWLIDNKFLSKYKIAVPQSDYQDYLKKAGSGSDYSKTAMSKASSESHIIGDVIENYLKFAEGKQAIVFATDIKSAEDMEKKFKEYGVTAKLLTGNSTDKERLDEMLAFQDKRTKVLINVDLFDEGLDVPGIECVIMARPTMSLSKYRQMIGRGLRIAQGKDYCIIIDHVGNVARHGLPCENTQWTLDRIIKRRDKVNLIRICSNPMCNAPYDRTLTECPWCGEPPFSSGGGGGGRIGPAQVDGDLFLIDPETLREMERDTELEDPASVGERVAHVSNSAAGIRAMKNQQARIETQKELSKLIAMWAGYMRHYGMTDRSIHKRFYIEFGKTITQALSEPKREMEGTIGALSTQVRI